MGLASTLLAGSVVELGLLQAKHKTGKASISDLIFMR